MEEPEIRETPKIPLPGTLEDLIGKVNTPNVGDEDKRHDDGTPYETDELVEMLRENYRDLYRAKVIRGMKPEDAEELTRSVVEMKIESENTPKEE